jgi:hypothetical protein
MNPMVARKVHAAALAFKVEELDTPLEELVQTSKEPKPNDSETALERVFEAAELTE